MLNVEQIFSRWRNDRPDELPLSPAEFPASQGGSLAEGSAGNEG